MYLQLCSVTPPHAANKVYSASNARNYLKLGGGTGVDRAEKKVLNITTFPESPVGQGSRQNILTVEYTLTLDDVSLTRQVLPATSAACCLYFVCLFERVQRLYC